MPEKEQQATIFAFILLQEIHPGNFKQFLSENPELYKSA